LDQHSSKTLAPTPDFIAAMGQNVSSVCVITSAQDGKRVGLTATAMSSVCAEPPRLLVCVNKNGSSHDMIASSGFFCVNVLAEEQEKVAKAFAGMMGRDFDRFSVGEWDEMISGAPALKNATAVFDCCVHQIIDQFSHSIIIGEVLAVRHVTKQDTLLYGARRFRGLRKTVSEFESSADEPHMFWG
jgi:flavin reductase (DIM6/NTAB) family NADH-FMN oxidoreductase RutF